METYADRASWYAGRIASPENPWMGCDERHLTVVGEGERQPVEVVVDEIELRRA